MRVYLLALFIAAVVTYLVVPLVRSVSRESGILTPVRARDVHASPIPRLGGLAMLAGFVVSILMVRGAPFLSHVVTWNSPVAGIIYGSLLVCLVGVVDDIWDLDWFTKLIGQILAAGVMAWQGVQLVSLPIAGVTIISPLTSLVITVLFTVSCMNAVNFVDGLDGLAAGMIGIGALGLFGYSYGLTRATNPTDYSSGACLALAATVGICLGFLAHNFNPASIFMGDTGSMLLGLIVAGCAILLTGQVDPVNLPGRAVVPVLLPIVFPFAALLFPLVDMVWAVVRRLKAGQPPFQADGRHIHHRMLAASGGRQRRAVGVLYVWSATVIFPVSSLLYVSWYLAAAFFVLGLICSIVCAYFWLPGLRQKHQPEK